MNNTMTEHQAQLFIRDKQIADVTEKLMRKSIDFDVAISDKSELRDLYYKIDDLYIESHKSEVILRICFIVTNILWLICVLALFGIVK